MNIKTLENDIFWQKHVLLNSKDSKQKERAKNAIIKLENQLKELKNELITRNRNLRTGGL